MLKILRIFSSQKKCSATYMMIIFLFWEILTIYYLKVLLKPSRKLDEINLAWAFD